MNIEQQLQRFLDIGDGDDFYTNGHKISDTK